MSDFVHLHVHSQYSMLDSALRLKALVKRAAELKATAVALTDHGNMFGALQFHRACTKAGIAPILGCEVNVCRDHTTERPDGNHLVLLAAGQQGYRNLVRLVSLGWVDGLKHGRPHIDFEQLAQHRQGLVGLSACMGGFVAQEVLQKGEEAGREALSRLRDCFEPDRFYVELQDHGFMEQKPLNEILVSLARELSLPVVATNDCHYLEKQHARAQMVLQCISAGVSVEEMERSHHKSEELYMKSADEMRERFADLPEALDNTLRIAELCAGSCDPLAKPMLPRFQLPDDTSEETHLRQLADQGLLDRYADFEAVGKEVDRDAYEQRLHWECDIVCKMGYEGYYLIVYDFIRWARERGIPVGPGRGSGAGSLVAYCLRITDLDPIPYGLLFERFLNPDRVSMPDFDIDFCMDRREEVIDYVREKYGEQSVGQIATFHLLKSRSVVRDVGRVMGMTPQDAGRIATLIPEPVQGKVVPIAKALMKEKRLKAAYDQDPKVHQLLDTAMSLEDLNRHAGMHAAGVVISEGVLWDHVPVFCPEPNTYVTQYDKDDVVAAGLVKFDFLGLKTLTTIDIACKLINRRPDQQTPFRIDRIPLDDPATYRLLQTGDTTNIFQLESSGMQDLIKRFKPDCFEDLIAVGALYRPGPLGSGMIDDYIDGKHGRKQVRYPHASLEGCLEETFGVMVYQEQVMQAARDMAGYSLGQADLLRRAMGHKDEEEMASQKVSFVEGAVEQGHKAQDAELVFQLMDHFSGYGFNKSHSAAYALVTYQCAYMKTHYPVEFLCGALTADKDKIDRVVRTVAETRAMGITVLPPDVNDSEINFTVVYHRDRGPVERPEGRPAALAGKLLDPMHPEIRFGLGAVKGIGSAALESIFETRTSMASDQADQGGEAGPAKKEPFTDLFDFTSRVDLRRVNKGVVDALIQCGAMDTMHRGPGIGREQAHAALDAAIERGKKIAADRESGQTSLFGMLESGADASAPISRGVFPQVERWDRRERLTRERNALGIYISGHPLDGYAEELKRFCSHNTLSVVGVREGTEVTIGGVVEEFRERSTKTGGRMGFFQLEDTHGRMEVIVRERALETHREQLKSTEPMLIKGVVKPERDRNGDIVETGQGMPIKLVLGELTPLVESFRSRTKSIRVRIHVDRLDRQKLEALRDALQEFPGNCPVTLMFDSDADWSVTMAPQKLTVDPSEAMMTRLERMFGEKICELR